MALRSGFGGFGGGGYGGGGFGGGGYGPYGQTFGSRRGAMGQFWQNRNPRPTPRFNEWGLLGQRDQAQGGGVGAADQFGRSLEQKRRATNPFYAWTRDLGWNPYAMPGEWGYSVGDRTQPSGAVDSGAAAGLSYGGGMPMVGPGGGAWSDVTGGGTGADTFAALQNYTGAGSGGMVNALGLGGAGGVGGRGRSSQRSNPWRQPLIRTMFGQR